MKNQKPVFMAIYVLGSSYSPGKAARRGKPMGISVYNIWARPCAPNKIDFAGTFAINVD